MYQISDSSRRVVYTVETLAESDSILNDSGFIYQQNNEDGDEVWYNLATHLTMYVVNTED